MQRSLSNGGRIETVYYREEGITRLAHLLGPAYSDGRRDIQFCRQISCRNSHLKETNGGQVNLDTLRKNQVLTFKGEQVQVSELLGAGILINEDGQPDREVIINFTRTVQSSTLSAEPFPEDDGAMSVHPPVPPVNDTEIALVRQYSGSGQLQSDALCFLCKESIPPLDPVVPSECNVRLGCRCVCHLHCLISYIRHSLSNIFYFSDIDPTTRGIECPYKLDCPLKAEPCMDSPNVLPRAYFITAADIVQIRVLAVKNITLLNGVDPLTTEELEVFKTRALKEKYDPVISEGYMALTSKPCPTCSIPVSRFHGHECHHSK